MKNMARRLQKAGAHSSRIWRAKTNAIAAAAN
jgi:hypothetical protein